MKRINDPSISTQPKIILLNISKKKGATQIYLRMAQDVNESDESRGTEGVASEKE